MVKTPDYFRDETILITGAAGAGAREFGAIDFLLNSAGSALRRAVALLLCSDACGFMTAETVDVSGGGWR